MALRALLFSSDGTTTSALCQVLTDLGIEAEICSEVLVAAGRIGRENYDAVLVDWDQETDATALLKATREQRATSQSLNLALVQNDKDVGRALQQGANSIIKKPVDPQQAHDTLSTARDLILSRHTEHKEKEARVAALKAESAAVAAELANGDDAPAKKTGFLAQTAPKSAFEVEELTEKQAPVAQGGASREPAGVEPAPFPGIGSEPAEVSSTEKASKRWDEKPKSYKPPVEEPAFEPQRSQDTHGVFSSLPEEEPEAETDHHSHPQYLVFALVGCLLVAGVLWVWAPGDSYRGRMSSWWSSLASLTKSQQAQPAAEVPETPAPEKPATSARSENAEEAAADSALDTTDVDPNKIQIIETKVLPKPGAQQPPSTDPPPDSDQAKQSTEPGTSVAVVAPPQPAPSPIQPVVIPVSRPQPLVSVPDNPPSASDGRTGVIIPDSLKSTPSATPANSLEPSTVPEEISRDLVAHRVDPVYPAQALPQRLEGLVVLQVSVARDGTVQDVKLVKGYFALARAAFDAVRQWRFKPYSPNGRPVDFQTYVTVTFKYPG